MPSLVSIWQFLAKVTAVYFQLNLLFLGNVVHSGSHKECSRYASDACLRYGTCCSPPPGFPDPCCHIDPNGIVIERHSFNGVFWATRGLMAADCNGTYKFYCDPAREYTNITSILTAAGKSYLLDFMKTYWTAPDINDEDLWAHEWAKYGTCISALDPPCYSDYTPQQEVVDYFQFSTRYYPDGSVGFPTNPGSDLAVAGILPSTTQTYTADEITKAFGVGYPPLLQCKRGELTDIWWYSYPYLEADLVNGIGFLIPPVGDNHSPCPATGIKYLPKPFSGKGTIRMAGYFKPDGCLTSTGTVVYGGPCATFVATPTEGKFTLTTSMGKCAVRDHLFTCSPTITHATLFFNLDLFIGRNPLPSSTQNNELEYGWWIWYAGEQPNTTSSSSSSPSPSEPEPELEFPISATFSTAEFPRNVFLRFDI